MPVPVKKTMVSRGMPTPLAFSGRMIKVQLGFLSGSQLFLMSLKLCAVVDFNTLGRLLKLGFVTSLRD